MAGYSSQEERKSQRSEKTSRTSLSQSSRLLAPTRSSLAKSRPSDVPKTEGGDRGRRLSDVSDLTSNAGRDSKSEGKARRSSFPVEDGSGSGKEGKHSGDEGYRSSASKAGPQRTSGVGSGGSAGASKGRAGDSRSMGSSRYGEYSSLDVSKYSPEKAKYSPEKTKYSPEKSKYSPEKPKPSTEKPKYSPEKLQKKTPRPATAEPQNRAQGRPAAPAVDETTKLIGGGMTQAAARKEAQSKPGVSALPTSPRASAMPTSPRAVSPMPTSPRAMPTSPRARQEAMPRSPISEKRAAEVARASHSNSGARKEKAAVQRSTLNPSQRGTPHLDGLIAPLGIGSEGGWPTGLGDLRASYAEGESFVQMGNGTGDQWAEDVLARGGVRGSFPVGSAGIEAFLDRTMVPGYDRAEVSYSRFEASSSDRTGGWQDGTYLEHSSMHSEVTMRSENALHKVTAHQAHLEMGHMSADTSALSTSELSSVQDEEEYGVKSASGTGRKGASGSGIGGKEDEGSPVSVLDATMSEVLKGQDSKAASARSASAAPPWQGEPMVGQSAVVPIEHHEEGLSAAAAAVVAAIGSPLPSYLLDIANLDFMGDISGMEQDLEYVRHVLLLSGFAGKVLPPVHSETNPIHPGVFEQLEQGITTGSVEGAHDAIIIDKARQAEERRQRRLLFDAVNEALGRRLTPYYARPVWVKASQPVIRKLPLGKNLLKEVWEEIHDWPIASSDEVYDILDDAARRDMSRGTERWSEMGLERAETVFEIEKLVFESLLEEIAMDFSVMEAAKQERRAQAKGQAAQQKKEVPAGRS